MPKPKAPHPACTFRATNIPCGKPATHRVTFADGRPSQVLCFRHADKTWMTFDCTVTRAADSLVIAEGHR